MNVQQKHRSPRPRPQFCNDYTDYIEACILRDSRNRLAVMSMERRATKWVTLIIATTLIIRGQGLDTSNAGLLSG
jgi:hypothetical protein